ncbi:fibronectin type III domain-containing protein [Hymenobacter sp. 15J16-1T3B]|nr:fibronectin type III domain-containing protein [Hymenobacter sp. 15J16-1T3B]
MLTAALLGATTVNAQVDAYTLTPSQGTFTPVTGATTVAAIQTDDEASAAIPLGFTFQFDGVNYTQVVASSNGWVSFNSSTTDDYRFNELNVGPVGIRPLVAPLWDDLDGEVGTASYVTTGTSPNRVFTFEWLNWQWNYSATGSTISFQVKLYEGSNRVEFIYRPESGSINSASASIGLAGATVGSFLSLNNTSATPTASSTTETSNIATRPAAGQVYAFLPPVSTGCGTPRGLTATNLSLTSATLNWTALSGNGTFTIEYGPRGFTPGGGGSGVVTRTGISGNSLAITGLTPLTTYQFYVTQNCGGTLGNSSRSNAGTFTTINDECTSAAPLTPTISNNCTTRTRVTLTGATNSTGAPAPGCASYQGGDVWFSVVVPASGALTIETDSVGGSSITDTGVALYTGTCGSLALSGCDDDGGTGTFSLLNSTNLVPGSTVYVRLWQYSNANPTGAVYICARTTSNCATPTAPVATPTATGAALSWGGTLGTGETFSVQYRQQSTPTYTTVNNITSASTTLTGLLPNTNYCFTVTKNCGAQQGASVPSTEVCFLTLTPVPQNDEPCGAVALSVTATGAVSGTGTTLGSTTSVQPGITLPATCSPALSPKDVWFRVTVPAGVTAISGFVTGNPAGMVRLYTAATCSTGFALVGCQASARNNQSVGAISFTGLTAGTTYYMAVSGYGSGDTQGTFTISTTATASRNALLGGQLAVYPNPVHGGTLTLRLDGAGKASAGQAQLINSLGQVVRAQAVSIRNGAAEQQLSVEGLSHGLYTLRLQVDGAVVTRSVAVE